MSQQERWQLSGKAAEFYERYVSLRMDPWVHGLIEVAALQAGERVLDLACRIGFVARLAAERVETAGRVVGVDLNPGVGGSIPSRAAPGICCRGCARRR
jgi:ubiquinone/menaquinone biosynthesis C-methylase UbiE